MKWTAADICLVILTLTIPISIFGLIAIRLITGSPISVEAGAVVMDMLKVIGGGVLSLLGALMAGKKEN